MIGRENLIVALEAGQPERIPYTVYEDFMSKDPFWEEYLDQGMVMIPSAPTVQRILSENVQQVVSEEIYQGSQLVKSPIALP